MDVMSSVAATPGEIRRAAARLIRLRERRCEDVQRCVGDAWVEVGRLTRAFREIDPALQRVVLFGSLARGEVTCPDFDIDLAVACSRHSFLQLVAEALNSSFQVDLVDLGSADERIRGSILRDGIVLYEK